MGLGAKPPCTLIQICLRQNLLCSVFRCCPVFNAMTMVTAVAILVAMMLRRARWKVGAVDEQHQPFRPRRYDSLSGGDFVRGCSRPLVDLFLGAERTGYV